MHRSPDLSLLCRHARAINRNSAAAYNTLVYLVSFFIFAAHFGITLGAAETRVSALYQIAPAAIVVLGTMMFAHARDPLPADDFSQPSIGGSAEPISETFRNLRDLTERDALLGDMEDKLLDPMFARPSPVLVESRGSRSETDLSAVHKTALERTLHAEA